MKKILIIHTGGTFGMTPAEPDQTLKPGNIEKDLNENLPFVRDFADISVRIPFNMDSSDIGPQEWLVLYRLIKEQIDPYDGVVIIHGTDTLVYTAAALSFLLHDLQKPVILTGAQRPLSVLRSDARSNLINSVEVATLAVPEVLVCFGNQLFRGNRTKKISIESFQSFDSPNYPPLANIGLNVSLNKPYILREKSDIDLRAVFDSRILPIQIFPGFTPEPYMSVLEGDTRAIILEGFGAGNFPAVTSAWIDFIRNARAAQKMVFICSQSPHGVVNLDLYTSGRQAREAGAISLHDMTAEAAVVKLMILLGNHLDNGKIEALMKTSLAGEITIF